MYYYSPLISCHPLLLLQGTSPAQLPSTSTYCLPSFPLNLVLQSLQLHLLPEHNQQKPQDKMITHTHARTHAHACTRACTHTHTHPPSIHYSLIHPPPSCICVFIAHSLGMCGGNLFISSGQCLRLFFLKVYGDNEEGIMCTSKTASAGAGFEQPS